MVTHSTRFLILCCFISYGALQSAEVPHSSFEDSDLDEVTVASSPRTPRSTAKQLQCWARACLVRGKLFQPPHSLTPDQCDRLRQIRAKIEARRFDANIAGLDAELAGLNAELAELEELPSAPARRSSSDSSDSSHTSGAPRQEIMAGGGGGRFSGAASAVRSFVSSHGSDLADAAGQARDCFHEHCGDCMDECGDPVLECCREYNPCWDCCECLYDCFSGCGRCGLATLVLFAGGVICCGKQIKKCCDSLCSLCNDLCKEVVCPWCRKKCGKDLPKKPQPHQKYMNGGRSTVVSPDSSGVGVSPSGVGAAWSPAQEAEVRRMEGYLA